MRLFTASFIFLLAFSTNTGNARHAIQTCGQNNSGAVYNHGSNDPNALVCCPANNGYAWTSGYSCPTNSGRCPSGKKECPGPGPRYRCIPDNEICRPMKSPNGISSRIRSFLGITPPAITQPTQVAMPSTRTYSIALPTPTHSTYTPCIPTTKTIQSNTPKKDTAACAPKIFCTAGPLADYDICSKKISAQYQVTIDKIAADLRDASKPIQSEWNKLKNDFDLNSIIQNCIRTTNPSIPIDNCYKQATGTTPSAEMSAYLKQYAVWIRDTSTQDRDAATLKQCGDPKTLKCDKEDFGCPSVCTTDSQTGAITCSD